MIEFREQDGELVVRCDRCQRQQTIEGAQSRRQALEMAAHQGWAVRTERGDLCPACAERWVLESLTQE